MVNRLYLQYNYDSSNLSFSKTLILSILPPLQKKKKRFCFEPPSKSRKRFCFLCCFFTKAKRETTALEKGKRRER